MSNDECLRLSEKEYDLGIFHPALRRLYEGTDLYNYGYWRAVGGQRIASLPEAAGRLVALHVEADPHRAGVRRVLDVGCGLGACTARIAEGYPGATVVGVNYSGRQVEHARLHHAGPRVSFLRMDAGSLSFPDRSFDRIHCVESALHFRPRSRFLDEARRLLVPGGRLILTDVLTDGPSSVVPSANVVPSVAAYVAVLAAAGLRPIEVRDVHADTVVPFVAVLRTNAMAAYARAIARSITGYVLAHAVSPG